MAIDISIMNDHRAEIMAMMKEKTQEALWRCGEKAEGYAKKNCRDFLPDVVETGLLRNSITHAYMGKAPKIGSYKADKGGGSGSYSGTAPQAQLDTEYIGTNVEYAQFAEFGTGTHSHIGPRPFLRNAVADHAQEYRDTISKVMHGKVT